jgi:hypothetical protein
MEDLSGRSGKDGLWGLFDGDPATGISSSGTTRIRLTFAEPIAVTSVGGFSAAAGTLAVRGPEGTDTGGGSIELTGQGGRWVRVKTSSPREARTFVVEWTARSSSGGLSELEIWGRTPGGSSQEGADATEVAFGALPVGAESFSADGEAHRISVASPADRRKFAIEVPRDPRSIDRTFLVYELDGLPSFTATTRRINGGPAVGGFGVSLGTQGGLQVEEISPTALREGTNTVEFLPIGDNPVGYVIRGLRLIVTHASTAAASPVDVGLSSGDETLGWEGESGAIRRWRFSEKAQPHELRIRVWRKQLGHLVLAAGGTTDRRARSIDLEELDAGWHIVPLDDFPSVDELTLGLEATPGRKIQLADVVLTGSPLPEREAHLRITYPLHGECVNHQIHVRGLTTSPASGIVANGAPMHSALFEAGAVSFTATEKQLGGEAGQPFSFVVETTGGSGPGRATVDIAGCVDRPAAVAGADGRPVQPREDSGAPYGVLVKASKGAKLSFAGVDLDVPAGAVDKDVRLTIRPLSPEQVPVLDAGMVNVSAGGRAFRLGPRGMVFKKPIALSVPIDRSRTEPEDAIRTFYFDEAVRQWREVATEAASAGRVTARTTHFTDFIAATLALPEHPGLQSLDPTSLKQIKIADPAAGVELMAPPEPNARGTANLNYPIEVPPGRLGMEPHLAITYDSSRANGWLGVGWDLSTSSIEIDTRFGVPRYDGTERYALDGEQLTAATNPPVGAPAGTYYVRRNEGRFDWIQRVNLSGGGYSWLVTDKRGVKYTYGQSDAGRLMAMNGTGVDRVRTFKWLLEQVEDINGNQVRYSYAVFRGSNGDQFVQVYPSQVTYTASSQSGAPAPTYSVVFNLQSGIRADAFSTGRPGFQVLTQKLLDSVDVKNGTSIVRRYKLTYTTGDFGKTLLKTVAVLGKGATGTPIAQHDLAYYQTPRDANNNPKIFGSPTAAGPNGYSTVLDAAGALATSESLHDTSSFDDTNSVSIGIAGASHSTTTTFGNTMLEDADGDGLPDYFLTSLQSTVGSKQALQLQNGVLTGQMSLANFPGWFGSFDTNHYLASSYDLLALDGGQDYGNISEAGTLHQDVNGDGLLDLVMGADDDALHVRLNQGGLLGFGPEIVLPGYTKTGLGLDCSDVFANGNQAAPLTQNPFPTADIITKWVAPYAGTIRITGNMTRQEAGGDGMIASLYLENFKLWERQIDPNDMSPCTPADAAPAVGSTCDPTGTTGFVRTVSKGDRLYTRVNGINCCARQLMSA